MRSVPTNDFSEWSEHFDADEITAHDILAASWITMIRLETLAPGLVATLRNSSSAIQRAASLAACECAVRQLQIDHPLVLAAIDELRATGMLSTAERAKVDKLAAQLDDTYLAMQEAEEQSLLANGQHTRVFRQARAVASVAFAGDQDSLYGALEGIYEAIVAARDKDEIISIVRATLE